MTLLMRGGPPVVTKKIFIVRWALGKGEISTCYADIDDKGYASYNKGGYHIFVSKGDYYLSEEEALHAAEEMRIKKLQSLAKQSQKVSCVKFTIKALE